MADEKKSAKPAAGEEATPAAKSGMVKMIAIVAAVVIVPLALAAGVYFMVLAPRLQPAEGEHAEATHGEAHEEEESHGEAAAEMPGAAAVEFDDESVNIMPDKEGGKSALLNYKCALVVNSELLAEEVGEKSKKPFFSSIILRLHSNRTKTELSDPRVKESILRQAKQECNALLKRLFPEDKEAEVLEVLHVKYTIFEI